MIFPVLYYVCIVFWLPRTMTQRIQFLLGLCIYVVGGPFLNMYVLAYSLWNMDSFGWGKTRKIVESSEDTDGSATGEAARTNVPDDPHMSEKIV